MKSIIPDVVIVGGGVAGLSAAIGCVRNGLSSLLLEQNSELGKRIKGEVINPSADVFQKIFHGDGLPQLMKKIEFTAARYYTPSTRKVANRGFPPHEKIGIEYRELIDELAKVAIHEGVQIHLNSAVSDFIEKDNKIIGLKYQEFGEVRDIFPKFIICASGLHSSLGIANLKPPKNIFPALKIIVENLNLPDAHTLEFFFLDIPGVIWIFPKSNTRAELGITLWMDPENDLSEKKMNDVLNEKSKNHPLLKDRLRHSAYIYYSYEKVAFGGPAKTIYAPNIVFIGDVMGHVGAIGGSGIISSMTIGYDTGSLLGKILKQTTELQLQDFQAVQDSSMKSVIGKKLKKEQSTAQVMRELLYKPVKSPEQIDALWDKFKIFIESRGA